MAEIVVLFIGLSILFYTILAGADFGAGIIEIFTGKKGINTISKAIAPVWEANHIWIIIVIVVVFNAFPVVFSTIMLVLHIPMFLVLIGIIFRGTAFTFRYYDVYQDKSHDYYTFFFKLFSLLTPLFLGMNLGAIMLGKITLAENVSFAEKFVFPWLTPFSFMMGVFVILLFAYLAAIYLIGETTDQNNREDFKKYARRLLIALVIAGSFVFLTARLQGLHLLTDFLTSKISLACGILATLTIPVLWVWIKKEKVHLIRIVAGFQTALIIVGWFGIQFPVLVSIKNAESLTIYNSVAPDKTLAMLITALIVGLMVVIPLLLYLFKVFKFSENKDI
ncbi:MAG: cytochrome d ubiquinol oxidase subunit II [Bacteroidales bacterium]|nr:cytochrome d ubiquinol oxidase subunit II [Bacteroidales bacterium]